MKVGIIGAGRVGGTLGRRLAEEGHEIMFGVRDPRSPKVAALLETIRARAQADIVAEAVSFGEAVVLAVGWPSVQEVIQQAGDWSGKIVLDATNRMGPKYPGVMPSAAEDIAEWAAGAEVVKAFNTTGFENMANPRLGSQKADIFICGDDEAAKSVATELAEAIGFDVVDVGPLSNAALLESLANLWIEMAYRQGFGRGFAFKIVRR